MQRSLNFDDGSRTFCYVHEGLLAAAHVMAEHHLSEVLVLDGENRVVGTYLLSPQGIQFRPAFPVTAAHSSRSRPPKN